MIKQRGQRLKTLLVGLLLCLSTSLFAEPLINMVSVQDGLAFDSNENISDDYIRLTLLDPSYQAAASIQQSIENWLGPDMVILDAIDTLKVQAPRDSTKRVKFISALLSLEIEN